MQWTLITTPVLQQQRFCSIFLMNLKVAISTFNEINPDELWLTIGTGSNLVSMKLLLTWILELIFVLHTFPMIHAFTEYIHGKFIPKSSIISVAAN